MPCENKKQWKNEPTHLLLPTGADGSNKSRPADIFIPNLYQGKGAALDVSIIHTDQDKFLNSNTPQEALSKYGKDVKEKKYTATCQARNIDFIPLMANVHGAWAPEAMKIFRLAAKHISAHENISQSVAMFYVMSQINVMLVKKVAYSCLQRTKGLQEEFPDVDEPINEVLRG